MHEWLFSFLDYASPVEATTLAVTCWHIWESRNDARNGKDHLQPIRVASKIKAYVENIVQHCYKPSTASRCESTTAPKWIPPPCGQVCVNVDAAVFQAEHRMGWGAVVRDHTGSVLLACNEGVDGITAPEMAEAVAVRQALSITRDKGFQKIILMSDCLSLIQRILSSEKDRSAVGIVVADIKSLATEFSTVSFKHTSRKNNVAAHLLARSSETTLCIFSFHVLPVAIRKELCIDVS
jgi:ribonuclease HI